MQWRMRPRGGGVREWQPLWIDEATGKLKFSVHSMHPYKVWPDHQILVHNCGARVSKAVDQRVPLEPHIIALKRLWENCVSTRDPHRQAISSECLSCCTWDVEGLLSCCLCGLTLHSSCCKDVSRVVEGLFTLRAITMVSKSSLK